MRCVAREDEDDEERREGLVGVGCPAEEIDMFVKPKYFSLGAEDATCEECAYA